MATSGYNNRSQPLAGRYEVERELGRGGMATVYLARDIRHDRHVAIKVLLPELTATAGNDRFVREIRLVARLQHPHILPLFDSGEASGMMFFVMPFVDGESLRGRLDRDGSLPLGETMRLVRQLADALDYAHGRGVVHRDVKPGNVLLTGGQAVLADFGIAHASVTSSPEAGTLTSAGMALGTPAYMSPEQAAAEVDIDGRSDLYSLGCVCYEMLAGSPPFSGANAIAIMSRHISVPPPPLEGIRETLPEGVKRAVARALEKNPFDRFGTVGDFAAALETGVVGAMTESAADLRIRAIERQQELRERVLVLDFANIAGAADAEWLSTGIAETVTADLNRIARVRIVGQDAGTRQRLDRAYRGRLVRTDEALDLARSVGARWVVWGGFQKFGPRIRITAHVGGTSDGTSSHEEKLDGTMDDIFVLQDRIVATVTNALGIELTSGEVKRIRSDTPDLSAYEHVARGRQAWHRFGKESIQTAADHFRAAIALDPNYALAYSGLGVIQGPRYIATGDRSILNEGVVLLERAIALDPAIGEAYAWLSYMQGRQDRPDDAIATARRGIEREPASFFCWYMLGCAHLFKAALMRRPQELARAVAPYLRSILIDPGFHPAHMALGSIYVLRGDYGHAKGLIDRAVELELAGSGHQFVGSLVQRALLHAGSDEPEPARDFLDRAIQRYTGADHVYAETMRAFAHWARGCVGERTGNLSEARGDFEQACTIADANPGRISIGAHWVKARLGLARVLYRLGHHVEADRSYSDAMDLFESRRRFVWTWFVGALDADVLAEIASTQATLGLTDSAIETLTRAADAGWADVTWLRHDPAFVELRDTEIVTRLCRDAAARVTLPPPTGSGGLGGDE